MTTLPPQSPQPGHRPKKRGWITPVAIIGALMLAVCCIGGIAVVAFTGDPDTDGPDTATGEPDSATTGPAEAAEPGQDATSEAGQDATSEPEPENEPAGFRSGIWEVDTDIPPGTYVTIAPGGSFDSCYWARLSGFSGDFDDIITNGNLNAGARGRLTIAGDDAGVEFSGPCVWTRN